MHTILSFHRLHVSISDFIEKLDASLLEHPFLHHGCIRQVSVARRLPQRSGLLRNVFNANYPKSSGIIHAANIGLIFAQVRIATIILSVFFLLQTRNEN
jgi:hypothetical protein